MAMNVNNYNYLSTEVKYESGKSPLDITLANIYEKKAFFDITDYLVKHGCHSDDVQLKLLCGACMWGNLEIVKELVGQLKVNPNGELCMTVTNSYNYIKILMIQELYIMIV